MDPDASVLKLKTLFVRKWLLSIGSIEDKLKSFEPRIDQAIGLIDALDRFDPRGLFRVMAAEMFWNPVPLFATLVHTPVSLIAIIRQTLKASNNGPL